MQRTYHAPKYNQANSTVFNSSNYIVFSLDSAAGQIILIILRDGERTPSQKILREPALL